MQSEPNEDPMLFGFTVDELERRGAIVTALEIAQQPKLWTMLAALLEEQSDAIEAFLAAPFAFQDLLVVFTGAGTSALAGGIAATEAMASFGRETRRVATTDIVESWSHHLDPERPTLLVSFARSGDSPESVAALDIVDRHCRNAWHLVLTCNPEGALARASLGERRFSLVMPDGSCDEGFAMTGSFSVMTLSALSIFTGRSPSQCAPLIRNLSDHARTALAAWPKAAELVRRRHERVVFLGSGPLAEAAAECALKLLELTDGEVVATSYSPLAFRHGPKTIISGPQTLVMSLVSGDAAISRYGLDMIAELADEKRADLFILRPGRDVKAGGTPSLSFGDVGAEATDGWMAAPYVVFAQILALLTSLERGFRTDRPSRHGEVNRVVQNVQIYA